MPTPIPNEAYPFASAHDWLINKRGTDLPESLIRKLDGDDIQDEFQDEMEGDGFFTPKQDWMLSHADKGDIVACVECGEITTAREGLGFACSESENGEHRLSDTAIDAQDKRDWLDENYSQPSELYEFGKEQGWWA